jgi:hypothetical protein
MSKPNEGRSNSRRDRKNVGGFTVGGQLRSKLDTRGYGALLDQLARTTRPEKGRKPKINRPVRKPVSS